MSASHLSPAEIAALLPELKAAIERYANVPTYPGRAVDTNSVLRAATALLATVEQQAARIAELVDDGARITALVDKLRANLPLMHGMAGLLGDEPAAIAARDRRIAELESAVPAFQCGECGGYVASRDLAMPCPHCRVKVLESGLQAAIAWGLQEPSRDPDEQAEYESVCGAVNRAAFPAPKEQP